MAKEDGIKKIELRVSVDCCDGCKRKVKKALQGVEGVLKTEIDPSEPKVTAIGNVDPKVLIKKLLKAGKQAELWSGRNQSSSAKELKVEMPAVTKSKPAECEKDKSSSDSCCRTIDKDNKESKNNGEINGRKGYKASPPKEEVKESSAKSSIPEVNKNENPLPPKTLTEEAGNIKNQTQFYYMVEPYPIAVPSYYAVPSYATHPLPPPPPPTCYGQPFYFCQERPAFQPMFQAPAAAAVTRVGDYFSDENTVGCLVM